MSQWTAITALQAELNRVNENIESSLRQIKIVRDKIDELTNKIKQYENMINGLNSASSKANNAQSNANLSVNLFNLLGSSNSLGKCIDSITSISGRISSIISSIKTAIESATKKKLELEEEKNKYLKEEEILSNHIQSLYEAERNLSSQIEQLKSSL